jgi:F-type H+-transporting ATPase subunit b
MSNRNGILLLLLCAVLFLGMSSGEGGETAGASGFLGKVVNFVLLFGGLAFLLFKPLRAFVDGAISQARSSLDESRASRETAESRFEESKTRMTGLGGEIRKMKDDAASRGEREKERISKTAEEESERIRHLSRLEIEALTKGGIRELRAYAAEATTSLARDRIRGKIAAEDQSLLVDKSIERLARLNEKTDAD